MSILKVDTIQKADGTGSLSVPAESGTVVTTASPSLGRRNLIINGAMQVWQRGTSFNPSSGFGYTADRWQTYSYATNSATVSRQSFTVGQTDVPDSPEYFVRVAGTSVRPYLEQRIENVTQFGGRTLTLSLWAKSSDVSNFSIDTYSGFGSGGSADVVDNNGQAIGALSSTWTKFTYTWTVPSHSGKTIGSGNFYGIDLSGDGVGTIDIALVQLEFGSVATPFEHRSYGEELALCQRYFTKFDGEGSKTITHLNGGIAYNGTDVGQCGASFPVTMRAFPTVTYGNTVNVWNGSQTGVTSVVANNCSRTTATLNVQAAAVTNGVPYQVIGTGYIHFDSEL